MIAVSSQIGCELCLTQLDHRCPLYPQKRTSCGTPDAFVNQDWRIELDLSTRKAPSFKLGKRP